MHEGSVEGLANEVFSRAVVGGCIEGADAEGKGAVDNTSSGEGVGIGVILVVEGCGAEDEGRKDLGDGGSCRRHDEENCCATE